MGSKQSSENKYNVDEENEDQDILTKSKDDSGFFYMKETYSSYRGIRSSCVIDQDKSVSKSFSEQSENFFETNSISKQPEIKKDSILATTTFIWSEDAQIVYLTGSWVNWNQRFLMNEQGNDHIVKLVMVIILLQDLPKGVHQYKFIINEGIWKTSKFYPTINDGHGNINNIIDNTNLIEEVKQPNTPKINLKSK